VVAAPDPVLGEVGWPTWSRRTHRSREARLLVELRDTVRAALADYKAPDRVVVVSSLPLTSMMKVDKRYLADRAARLPASGPVGSAVRREHARHD